MPQAATATMQKQQVPRGFTIGGIDSFAGQQDIDNEESNMLLLDQS